MECSLFVTIIQVSPLSIYDETKTLLRAKKYKQFFGSTGNIPKAKNEREKDNRTEATEGEWRDLPKVSL